LKFFGHDETAALTCLCPRLVPPRLVPMYKLHNILFPVEFSPRCEAAAGFVLSMAQRYHARVVLFHALHVPPPLYAGMNRIYPENYDFAGALEESRVNLQKFAEAQLPNAEVCCIAQSGDPAGTIADYAAKNAVDLIAMPTHGYGVFRSALLGSVTAKVLHDSTLPVWTSAHAETSHCAQPKPRRILCALDMAPESLVTLETALALTQDADASLELVHVPAATVPADVAEHRLQDLLAKAADHGHVAVRDIPRMTTQPEGEGGSVAEMIRNLGLRNMVDLVVIGRGAIQTNFGRLFANSYDIVRQAPCPVWSV